MDQPRGRSPSQGNRQHISPVPSPHLYHHTAQDFGLDPAVSGHTFTTASFNTAQGFTTPFLESTQPQQAQGISTDPSFYPNNHYNHATYQDNQYPAQNLDPSFTQNEYGFQNSGMQQHDYPNNQHYSYDQSFEASQQGAINPADLSKISSPQDHASPNLLSPDHHSSPGQPASPASTNGQYYTPQHSRHQSLDPASAYSLQGEWQGASFQQAQHRRAPSDQSDLSSNAGNSPYLGQQEVFDSVENTHSPYMNPQPDGNTFGMDAFSLGEHASPSHTPYISPRLMPTQAQGLGLSHDVMLGQHQMGVPGPEVYASQAEPYSNTVAMHHRNGSTVSDMGQANQYAPPTIQIDPAPGVSRQNSFEPGNGNFVDQLSPPSSKGGRGRSVSDVTGKRSPLSRSASPAGRSPSVQPSDTLSVHSHSPAPGSHSRDSSPGAGKNRRASTSSINSRDYILDLADPSRPNASPSHSSTRVQKHPANFQCTLCPKKFTRAYNLRSHLRTHTDERPFVCTVCSKAFARQHDRKRHEGLHSGEKKFVCKGELHSTPGTMWGCGRRFARADALGRHFRSEAGRVCIKPLLDEEAIERRNKMMMEQTQYQLNNAGMTGLQPVTQPLMYPDTGNGGFTLPAALLAQYPALQNIDWSLVPSAQDDGLSGNEMYEDEGEDGYLSDMPGQSVQSGMAMGYGEEQEHGQLIYQ